MLWMQLEFRHAGMSQPLPD